jgi:hypothetical protein
MLSLPSLISRSFVSADFSSRYFSSAEKELDDHAWRRDISNVGLSLGKEITFCTSFSCIFFSTLSLIVFLQTGL